MNEPVVFKGQNARLNWNAADVIRVTDVLHWVYADGADRMAAEKLERCRIPQLCPKQNPAMHTWQLRM
jgi:hypothetical protein